MFAEWNPIAYTSCEIRFALWMPHSWTDPLRYKIGDLARSQGPPQVSGGGGWVVVGGRSDFIGLLIHPNSDLEALQHARRRINAISSFAISPKIRI